MGALPESIVDQMMGKDAFSQWLGIEILETGEGKCKASLLIRPEMLNGFGIAHGGLAYSLADSVLAFAANSHGNHALSIKTSMTYLSKVLPGETLVAEARELYRNEKLGHYAIEITSSDRKIALFEGSVFRRSQTWKID